MRQTICLCAIVLFLISGCITQDHQLDEPEIATDVGLDSCRGDVAKLLQNEHIYAGCFSAGEDLLSCLGKYVIEVYGEEVPDDASEEKFLFVNDFLTTVNSKENLRGMDCRKAFNLGENSNYIYCEGKLRVPGTISPEGTILNATKYYPVDVIINNSDKLVQIGFSKSDLFKTNIISVECV